MNCPNCGAHCEDTQMFCAECGTPLKRTVPSVTEPVNEQQTDYSQPNFTTQDSADAYTNQSNYDQNAYSQGGYGQAGYGQPNQGYNQGGYGFGGYKVPIKKRNIAVGIILSIVTCGIYGIYWFIVMANDLNLASGHTEDTSGGVAFLLSLITCDIYGLYWFYKAGEKVAEIQRRNVGYSESNSGILYLILCLFGLGIVNYCLIQSELNKVAAYTE